MKNSRIIPVAVLAGLLTVVSLRGQDTTNVSWMVPATKLEAFETNVGTLIIKGTTELGVVSTRTGVISVRCKEFTDTLTSHKEHGIAIELGTQSQFKDVMLIDYDELGSLLQAIDYMNKLDVSVSPMDAFDAAYTTKGGFRIAALGNRRTGLVQFGVRDIRINAPPMVLSRDEMTRLSSLIDQARKQLDGLRG
jgi:hypothetical protein